MATKVPVPAFVQALPAPIRTMLRKQCGGDWRRVTLDARGGLVVHNNPQVEKPQPVAVRPKPMPLKALPRAQPIAPIPAPVVVNLPPAEDDSEHPPGYDRVGRNGIFIVAKTRPPSRKRSGSPRTAIELTKRILDIGGQFRRIPMNPKMRVYYLGYFLMEVWCADNTPPEIIRRQYYMLRRHIHIINDFFAGD